jgi:hypothetical protein
MSSQDDPEGAMERFEDLGRRLFRVTKEDLKKAEEAAEKLVDEAIGRASLEDLVSAHMLKGDSDTVAI